MMIEVVEQDLLTVGILSLFSSWTVEFDNFLLRTLYDSGSHSRMYERMSETNVQPCFSQLASCRIGAVFIPFDQV